MTYNKSSSMEKLYDSGVESLAAAYIKLLLKDCKHGKVIPYDLKTALYDVPLVTFVYNEDMVEYIYELGMEYIREWQRKDKVQRAAAKRVTKRVND